MKRDSYDIKLENHMSDLVTCYYPENIQDYLRKKQVMLAKVGQGSQSAKAQLKFEDLPRLLRMLNKQIVYTKRRNEIAGI